MQPNVLSANALTGHLIQLRTGPTGQFIAQVPGVSELTVTAPMREEAIEELRRAILDWIASGKLVALQVPCSTTPLKPPGWASNDPLEQELLDELTKMRQADLERTLGEYEQEDGACSSSSSTPTT